MMLVSLISLTLAALPAIVLAQDSQVPIVYDSVHNATSIVGTWSTKQGPGAIQTGPGFANPLNRSFIYPPTTGMSYSFTGDGFFEQALYRFAGNATKPNCVIGTILWQHGTYELLPNGSIVLTPFAADGRQQVQDPCAPISNQILDVNITVLFKQWRIFPLPGGGNHLNLYAFDGAPLPPMTLVANPPNMLPTAVLTKSNATDAANGTKAKRSTRIQARSDAPRRALVAGGIAGLAGVCAMLLLLL